MDMDQIGASYAEEAHVSFYQYLFRADEAKYRKATERDIVQKQGVSPSIAVRR